MLKIYLTPGQCFFAFCKIINYEISVLFMLLYSAFKKRNYKTKSNFKAS